MKDRANRREFSRVMTTVQVDLWASDRHVLSQRTRDISLKGLYVYCRQGWPAGTRCELVLRLGDGPCSLPVQAQARVKRSDKQGMAIEIVRLTSEGYTHLKQLLLYNAENPDQVQEEFDSHVGLRRRSYGT